MGALTLKSFPFELRGWDIEQFESIDPTDGFGSTTRIYISKNQIIQIEPDYNAQTFNTWLTDKGRQFFDSIFGIWSRTKQNIKKNNLKNKSYKYFIKQVTKTLYLFDHCNNQQNKKHFFIIVFTNLNLEILSLLLLISQNYSYIKLKRAENLKTNNDLEMNYQLNLASDKLKLINSTLCLLISNNPRYEGYALNLSLRQRFFKGNFKCLILGSFIDLTFPIFFLGSNFTPLKSIVEGNNLVCQDFKSAKNMLVIYNNELLKRKDGKNLIDMIKTLNSVHELAKSWNVLNMLTPSLYESGTQSLYSNVSSLIKQDIINFSSLYFLNVNIDNLSNIKQIIDSKILNYTLNTYDKFELNRWGFDQNPNFNQNKLRLPTLSKNYYYLPTSMFYENEASFINTEGLIKRTTKLILKKKTKSNWQILRRLFKQFKTNIMFLNHKNNHLIFFNLKKISTFKNFIYFNYFATSFLTNLSFYLTYKTKAFVLYVKYYKSKTQKINNTKLKYWLDDFFNGGKDGYSQNSLIMTNCSKIFRTKSTNFF